VDYVTLTGEPLVLRANVEREFKYPVMLFEGEVAAEVHVTVQWDLDGSVKIMDDRGYELSLAIPVSEGEVTLLSNSTSVVQRVAGKDAVYDVFWTPKEGVDKVVEGYKYTIYGKSLNGSSPVVSFDLGDLKFAESSDNSIIISQPKSAADLERDAEEVKGTEKDWSNSAAKSLSQADATSASADILSSAAKDPQDVHSDGLTLNWTDAIDSGHSVALDTSMSRLNIIPKKDIFGHFEIDPTVVGTTTSSISPGTVNSFEGEVRLLSSGNRINAFYYDGSNIVYKTSDDKGKTWSISATSTGSGTLASDTYRWSLVRTAVNDTLYASILYWRPAGDNMNFYAMRGFINGSVIQNWSSATLLGTTTENTVYCFNGSACPAVATVIDQGGIIYAAFTWIAGGASEYTYKILSSTDGGLTWSTSLTDVNPAGTTRPTMALAALNSSKVLFMYGRDDAANLFYRIYNGSTWGSLQTISTSTNLMSGISKQLSAASDDNFNAFVVFTNSTSGTGGILKLAKFSNDGTYQGTETADSTRRHRLPNVMYSLNGGLNIYTISGDFIYDTRLLAGTWELPFKAFTTSLVSPNQLTATNLFGDDNSGLWREGTASPYNIVFGMLREGTLLQSESKLSPSTSESFEGEHRIVATANGTLFAFYHEGADIRYKSSIDGSHTWTGNPTSISTGTVNSDDFRWTVLYHQNPTERISVLYYKQNSGNTDFKQKTYSVSGRTLVETAGSTIFSAANDASCSPTGVCASASASTDSNSTISYAAFSWKSGGTWNYRIQTSTDGGSSWSTSLFTTSVSTSQKFPIALTYLGGSKMLFAYTTYESANISYRIYNGSSWGSVQTLSGTGLSANSIKQLSADSNSTGHAFLAYPSGGTSGSLKVARFANSTGSNLAIDTADSTLSHSLASLMSTGVDTLFVYSISSGRIYATQYFNGTWIAPTNYILPDLSTLDQLTVAHKYPVLLVREGATAPHSLMTATDYVALEGYGVEPSINATEVGEMSISSIDPSSGSADPWLAAYYEKTPHHYAKRIKFTCNFAGTLASKIQTTNFLTCAEAAMVQNAVYHKDDWGFVGYVTVLNSGTMKVGAQVWRFCEKFPVTPQTPTGADPCGPSSDSLSAGARKLYWQQTRTITSAVTASDITIYMSYSTDGTKVTWYYQIGTAIPVAFSTHTKSPNIHSVFSIGTYNDGTYGLVKAKYFQVGVGSEYPINTDGWFVKISNPAYAPQTSGAMTVFTPGYSVQGDKAHVDFTFRWGGEKYTNIQATQYDCAGSFPPGTVKFSYKAASTPSTGVKYWPC
jgi:hypothetical protein